MERMRKLAQLGRGGMARVWLAVHRGPAGFRKLVVVKELRPELARDDASRHMFLDEARLAARLGHPNVVQTLEVGEDPHGDLFLVMEWLDGQSLRAVHRRRRLPLALEVRVLADVLAGLHHAHELRDFDGTRLSVVHRDVSPHNVFLTYDGHVKVLDFGIAQALTSTAETAGALLKGKLAYMPPEQAKGVPVDRRADVFAVGVMLWECLAGRRLWAGLSEATMLYRLGAGDLPDLAEHAPSAPPALVDACRRALALDPARRTPTAAAFREALDAWLREQPEPTDYGALAAFMDGAFAEERARMRALVDEHLRPERDAQRPARGDVEIALDTDALEEIDPEDADTGERWRVEGPYLPGARLARSPRAVLLEGTHRFTGDQVVLKRRLTGGRGADGAQRRTRLTRAAALEHPATCRIVDLVDGAAPDAVEVLVRERLPGPDVGEILLRREADADRMLRVAADVLQSLAEAHERGLVHGRLAPGHVILAGDGPGGVAAKVIGWEEPPWTQADAGEAGAFLAPEVAAGAEPDPRADLWAVGALVRAALVGDLADGRARARASLPSLQELLSRALAPRPGDRYASAVELLVDLARVEADVVALDGGAPRLGVASLAADRGTASLQARRHRMLSVGRPTVWVLDGDPAMRDPQVDAALARLAERYPVTRLDEEARAQAAEALVAGEVDPPWVVVFGDLHALLGERLLAELAVSAEVSRFLVSTHANLELLDSTIRDAGLDRQVVLPATVDAVCEAIRGTIDRTRRLRHRYDSVRFSLREARERLQALSADDAAPAGTS